MLFVMFFFMIDWFSDKVCLSSTTADKYRAGLSFANRADKLIQDKLSLFVKDEPLDKSIFQNNWKQFL